MLQTHFGIYIYWTALSQQARNDGPIRSKGSLFLHATK